MGIFNNLFKGESKEENNNSISWHELKSVDALQEAIKASNEKPVLLFKHSTRCSISSSALSRLERKWNNNETSASAYYLDLISFREVSNHIAQELNVNHQSPQMIILKNGKAIFNSSHMDINFDDVKTHAPA